MRGGPRVAGNGQRGGDRVRCAGWLAGWLNGGGEEANRRTGDAALLTKCRCLYGRHPAWRWRRPSRRRGCGDAGAALTLTPCLPAMRGRGAQQWRRGPRQPAAVCCNLQARRVARQLVRVRPCPLARALAARWPRSLRRAPALRHFRRGVGARAGRSVRRCSRSRRRPPPPAWRARRWAPFITSRASAAPARAGAVPRHRI